ncbi:MAG TPA: NUDIX domain-containing protein [bacterium]|nr:NUDIX domain-containing protein [bacterium]
MAAHDSAGGVVVRVAGDRILVALQREGPRRAYTLPKGHVEDGESVEDAARRETSEETGLRDLALLGPLGVRERLNFARTSWKRTHYMLFLDTRETAPAVPGPAEFALEWFPIDALPEMFWSEQRELIEASREYIRAAVTRHGVRRQFSRRAGAYARSKSHAHDRDLDLLIRHLQLRHDDRVLDVATGTGFTAFAAAERSHHVVGLDLTLGMLLEARRLDPAGTIQWIAADAGAIPFADGTFDAVTVRRAPHHFPQLEPAIREMLRVLRPGGRIGIIDQVPPDEETGRALMERVERLRDQSHAEMYTRAGWRALVERLGVVLAFSDLVERKLTFDSWLDLAGTDPGKRRGVADALASSSVEARAQIGDDGSEPRSFTKRWVVLVGTKA